MRAEEQHSKLIGAYVLDTLDPPERSEVEAHLAGCDTCRSELAELEAMKDVLGEIPPEALIHGPPDADLVLQRTLRQMRTETSGGLRRQRTLTSVAAAVALVAAIGAGVLVGQRTGPTVEAADPTPSGTTASRPPGTRVGTTVDAATNVRLTAELVPAPDWVRINASVAGIPQGEDCRLVVVAKDGKREIAGGWVVSEQGEAAGTNLDGSASVPPEDVAAIEVVNTDGRTFVSLPI